MNEQMESLEVRLGRLSEEKTYINTGQALAGQVRAERDGDAALCWVRDLALGLGVRLVNKIILTFVYFSGLWIS